LLVFVSVCVVVIFVVFAVVDIAVVAINKLFFTYQYGTFK
jgi:hypothetical protein